MANFLRGLGQAIGVAGAGISGYAKDEDDRKKQALLAAQEDRANEQLRLAQTMQAAQLDKFKKDDVQQLLQNRMALRKDRYRPATPLLKTGSPLDEPFQQIRDEQLKGDTETVGDQTFLAPIESDQQVRERETGETRQYNEGVTAKANAFQTARDKTQHQYDMEKEQARLANEPPDILKGTDADGNPIAYRIPVRGGPAAPIEGFRGSPVGTRGSAATEKKIKQNEAMLAMLDVAEEQAMLHPESFGWDKGIGLFPGMSNFSDPVNEWLDPKGVGPRAPVTNLGSMVVFNRSGSAVSMTEFGRQAGFVPGVYNSPEAIKSKIAMMRRQIEDETEAFSGYRPRSSRDEGAKPGLPANITGQSTKVPTYEEWVASKAGNP